MMKYRGSEIEVPDDDIYKNDALQRRPVVEFISSFLLDLDGPFVLAIDAPWGTGKTTLIRMLQAKLKNEGATNIYFNAWKVDYVTDPLVALVAAIDKVAPKDANTMDKFRGHMNTVKKLTTSVAKHGVIAAAKAATLGMLDLEDPLESIASDFTGDVTKNIVDSFQKENESLEKLRQELSEAISECSTEKQGKPIYFFIDELDRCRPSFAIETLERIKHLFDTRNLVFILSIDKRQLQSSVASIYGEGIDSQEYLRRFFDMEFSLPPAPQKQFIRAQMNSLEINTYLEGRKNSQQTRDDDDQLVSALAELATTFNISLRTLERVISRIALVCHQTPNTQFLDPILAAFLVILRTHNIDVFNDLASGHIEPRGAMEYVQNQRGGKSFRESRLGLIIEAYLIKGDSDQERRTRTIEGLKNATNTTSHTGTHARDLLSMLEHTPPHAFHRFDFNISTLISKVDLTHSLTAN
ncbi:P-loop NTPase fold protein [Aquabacterium sp. A3]|uniref:KAP family P-loop NTPase fold protein n=1 Tax=Aquabacterium sp. A3 TaxID=3132829 RepID=UPI003119B9EC